MSLYCRKGKNTVTQINGKFLTGRSLDGTKNIKQLLFFKAFKVC